MFFFPIGCLIFVLLFLSLPLLFFLAFFKIVSFSFEKLGLSPGTAILALILILLGSLVNIPLTKRRNFYIEKVSLLGLFRKPAVRQQGVSINLGGAVIPIIISLYFLTRVPLKPAVAATILMIIISNSLARVIPGRGIALPAIIPPIFSALISLVLSPGFAAPTAFISGVTGVLIGADLLKIGEVQKVSPGMLSIGGAGVFDGIFLVGIASVFLTSF